MGCVMRDNFYNVDFDGVSVRIILVAINSEQAIILD